ncbi:MAG: hypothetical protein JSV91_08500 [Phycisphaerales bacterium]|nr:MAG: hypothetical protein JSV91_08500 [Phycisphaerales bacterium]
MKMNRQLIALGSLLAAGMAATWFAPAASADVPGFRAEFLGDSGGIAAMNEAGVVVGTGTSGGSLRAWFAASGTPMTFLPLPAGMTSSWATDINDAGVIVGAVSEAYSPEFGGQAVAWFPDGQGGWDIELLGTIPGHVSGNATALNNLGDIVGYSSNGTYRYPVLFTDPDGVMDLSFTGIFDPQDVNDRRMVVDRSFIAKRLDLNTMAAEELGLPEGSYLATSGFAINESDQVAGVAILTTSTDCDRQAARFTDGVGWEILSTCGKYNGAEDMNDHGDVVMRLNLAPWVLLEGEGTFRIEDLITEGNGHWYVINSFGLAINNSRQMAVWAKNLTTGQNGAVLLTPMGVVPGDANADGVVDIDDIFAVLGAWGPCGGCPEDVTGDGLVNIDDIFEVLGNWS